MRFSERSSIHLTGCPTVIGGDRGAHVAGVDRHLVAEAASDVRRDDADAVLGHAGQPGEERAVGMGSLGGGVDGQAAAHPVVLGDGAARLHRRRVRAREHHLLLDHDLGSGEHAVGRHPVAGLPVEDVIVGAALDLVPDQRSVRVKRMADVDHRVERLVLDLDQFQRVAGAVAVLGDDERDLLTLEAHLVGGEHRLQIARDRSHPGDPARLQVRPGEHRVDARVLERGGGVDRGDPGMRERAAENRSVEHPGQLEVVDVPSQTADEATVLLAPQTTEADRTVRVRRIGLLADERDCHAAIVAGRHRRRRHRTPPRGRMPCGSRRPPPRPRR